MRRFELSVRLPQRTRDGRVGWRAVAEPVIVEAASLNDLCDGLHSALLDRGLIYHNCTAVRISGGGNSPDSLDEIRDQAEVILKRHGDVLMAALPPWKMRQRRWADEQAHVYTHVYAHDYTRVYAHV